jgi:hypothetical protein
VTRLVPASNFRWVSGEESLGHFESSPGRLRSFCTVCGSVSPARVGAHVSLALGNLLGELGVGVAGARHVFAGSKAPWHVIADTLPQHEAAPPDWAPEVNRPTPPPVTGATRGSCLCGSVSFSVSGAPARWLQCHCSRCRRGRSAAHGSNTFYPSAQFAWLTGREHVRLYRHPEAQRFAVSFCVKCGGAGPVERENVPFVLVAAGSFDADPGARPEAHIHVASQAPWYPITDTLPQYAELPP